MNECQQVFEDLKVYLSSAPLLSPSKSIEELFLYLAVSPTAVNATFVREEDKVQKPVYFTSRAFQDAKERYPLMEKLAFALVTIAHKFKPYFQAHTVIVQTDKPLQRAMSSPKAVGRMALWATELSEFNVQYCPCRIHTYKRPGGKRDSSMEYPHERIVHQTSRQNWCSTP